MADKEWAREQGLTAFAGIPMIVEGRSVGAMVAFSREPIDEDTVNILLSRLGKSRSETRPTMLLTL